jgi:hypothetical protein
MKPDFDFEKDYPEWWDWFVRQQAKDMRKWFEIIMRDSETEGRTPIYYVRFEDLTNDMEGPARGLLEYLLDIESLEGTNAETRLKEFCSKGKEAT